MMGILIPLLFWLSIPLSLILSVIGILKDNFWFVLLGAVLFIPVVYYMNGSPSLNGLAILLPLFPIASAAALREGNKTWAWILLLPAFLTVIWFVFAIMSYHLS